MNLESNALAKFDHVLAGQFVNLKLIRLKEFLLKSEVLLSSKFEEKNQITHEKELNTIKPVRKKLRISNTFILHFILYKVKESEPTRQEVNNFFILKIISKESHENFKTELF
jgi:hypothetical protein